MYSDLADQCRAIVEALANKDYRKAEELEEEIIKEAYMPESTRRLFSEKVDYLLSSFAEEVPLHLIDYNILASRVSLTERLYKTMAARVRYGEEDLPAAKVFLRNVAEHLLSGAQLAPDIEVYEDGSAIVPRLLERYIYSDALSWILANVSTHVTVAYPGGSSVDDLRGIARRLKELRLTVAEVII